ncbi:hypothetical protein [Microvirga yunnanensis]|uniref:hypothetical protein n=1 Tax=Microvirga yunnanensis TaxID=2953740 RepID=UPI0021C68271|nr:hypothetical protein [Microvirga sp. HBU65207]
MMEQLNAFSAHGSTLIDIGAADGYFGVGLVAAGVYTRSVCFERDPVTRESLLALARLNNVEDRITALGTADVNSIAELERAGVDLSDAVVLCDIEGGEFDIFSKELLGKLSKSRIIIELHNNMVENGDSLLQRLVSDAQTYFDISYIETGPRDPTSIPLLRDMADDDRWLLCSEGRGVYQNWMVLSPHEPLGNQKPQQSTGA